MGNSPGHWAAIRPARAPWCATPSRPTPNAKLGILSLFARLGAGFDIVSGGELQRVIAAGGSPGKVVFSGVGKTVAEMRLAQGDLLAIFSAGAKR